MDECIKAQKKLKSKTQEATRKYIRTLNNTKRKNEEFETQINSLQKNHDAIKEENLLLKKKISSIESDNNFLNGKNKNMEGYIQRLINEVNEVKKEKSDLEDENSKLSKELSADETHPAPEHDLIRKLNIEKELRNKLENEKHDLESKIKQLQEKIDSYGRQPKIEIKESGNKFGNLEGTNKKLEKENYELNKEIKNIKGNYDKLLNESQNQINLLKNEISKLKDGEYKVSADIKKLHKNYEDKCDIETRLKKEIDNFNERIKKLENERSELSKNNSKLKGENQASTFKLIELTKTMEESNKNSSETLEAMNNKISILTNEKDELLKKWDKLTKDKYQSDSEYIKTLELKLYEYQTNKKVNLPYNKSIEFSPIYNTNILMLRQNIKDLEVKIYEYEVFSKKYSHGDYLVTQELQQLSKRVSELIDDTKKNINEIERELENLEHEKGKDNYNSLRFSDQDSLKLQEDSSEGNLDKTDYKKKYDLKVIELKKVTEMAKKAMDDFTKYKQKKNEGTAKLMEKMETDSKKSSDEIKSLSIKLAEANSELQRIKGSGNLYDTNKKYGARCFQSMGWQSGVSF